MIKINPLSINDLLGLKKSGAPVTLTSHPGNASLYKLTLWSCGIPEHFWDVTCCKADANNWPMFRLINNKAELLVEESLYQKIMKETNSEKRFITTYQFTKNNERLGRFHVQVCESLFPGLVSSTSRLLLQEQKNLEEMFSFLAETKSEEVFPRFIDSEGVMRPIKESGIKQSDFTQSFMKLLKELDHLLFGDIPLEVKGGVCYGGIMPQLTLMLVQYWQTGRIDRYDISGPDMIKYSMHSRYQEELSSMLEHLWRWNPKLVPKNIVVHIFPGTVARVGYIQGHISEDIIQRKLYVLRNQNLCSKQNKKWGEISKAAKKEEELWPTNINPGKDHYFSQHDLQCHRGSLEVDEFWKDIPLKNMLDVLKRANNLLSIK